MAITLTSDPIVDVATVRDLLGWTNDNEIRLAINSVSARFLQYTNRVRITSATVTEYVRPTGLDYFWLHASPVTSITSIALYSDGVLDETLAATDYVLHATTGKVVLVGSVPSDSPERQIKVIYVGGWSTVPGDLVESALMLMKLDKQRRDGSLGVSSESSQGHSVSRESDDLPKAVSDRWAKYRYLV